MVGILLVLVDTLLVVEAVHLHQEATEMEPFPTLPAMVVPELFH